MILTVTANPAVDQTVWVERLEPGAVHRPSSVQLDPAGKGINVSRMAHRLGWPTIALGFVAGDVGRMVQDALDAERVQNHFVRVPGQTRIDVSIVEPGRSTSLYMPGPTVSAEAFAELEEMIGLWLPAGRILVIAGSLPPGVPTEAYARLITAANRRGVRCILDADGPALRLGMAARPFLIKPNRVEAEHLLGRSLGDLTAVAHGAVELAHRGIEVVIVSLGAKGAVCAHDGRTWLVVPPPVNRKSTVGSGDSLVAGVAVALARGGTLQEGLRLGTAAGAATASSPGTALGTAEEVARLVEQVRVEPLEVAA